MRGKTAGMHESRYKEELSLRDVDRIKTLVPGEVNETQIALIRSGHTSPQVGKHKGRK